jgi:starch phosphorylase
MKFFEANLELKQAIDGIASGQFSLGDRELFRPLVDALLYHDDFLLLADFTAYMKAQDQVKKAYQDVEKWTRMSIFNAARCGFFSSDRSIRQYCQDIWKVEPLKVE